MNTKEILKIISKILPSSRQWLIEEGLLEEVIEDGVIIYKITPKGFRYFNNPRREK